MHRQIALPRKKHRLEQRLIAELSNPETVDRAIVSALSYVMEESETYYGTKNNIDKNPELTLLLIEQMTTRRLSLSQMNMLSEIESHLVLKKFDFYSFPELDKIRIKSATICRKFFDNAELRNELEEQILHLDSKDPSYPDLLAFKLKIKPKKKPE